MDCNLIDKCWFVVRYVDKVQTETGMNNATYDMYGRKVNNITTPGLYIVNGKKVLVK